MGGLLRTLRFGPEAAVDVVLCCPGAMGGLIGPARGLWHDLGRALAVEDRSLIVVDYRQPNDENLCLVDALATVERAMTRGASRFVFCGHSFGGAVALQCAIATGPSCVGMLGLSTQSAGCENASELNPTPLLLLHGTNDVILPPQSSAMVRELAGYGDLEFLEGASHGLVECADELAERTRAFVGACFEPETRAEDEI